MKLCGGANSCGYFLLREQKDPLYLRDKLSQKHSKEQFEAAQKIEQDYSRFFTGWWKLFILIVINWLLALKWNVRKHSFQAMSVKVIRIVPVLLIRSGLKIYDLEHQTIWNPQLSSRLMTTRGGNLWQTALGANTPSLIL